MFIDTHAHLFYPNYNDDLDEVIQRAKNSGIDSIIVPATNLASSAQVLELTKKYDFIYGAVGVHPQDSNEWNDDIIQQLEKLAQNKKIVAIGEIGLDYYYDLSPKEKQIQAFKSQIDLALKLDKPIIVHNRDANDDIMKIINEYCGSGLKAQFHCFSENLETARELIKMNHFISFTGNVTFKKADELRKVVENLSPENLLLETDSPFMTPVPHRGKRNEPSYLKLIAEKIAELNHINLEDIARVTSFNVFRLFGIGKEPNRSITYKIGNALYINVTNRCNADCIFCTRENSPFISGYNLKMNKKDEPNSNEYIKEIGDPKQYSEIVFCGYGEPTIRWNIVKEIASYVKKNGGNTRLNTNGHGNKINKKDITKEMKGLLDKVSVSINAGNAKKYSEITKLDESYFYEAINFAKSCKENVDEVILTVVAFDEIDIEQARKIAVDIKAKFRIRKYF